MSISFNCESCKKRIKAPDSLAGKKANCPKCKAECVIPMPEPEVESDFEELKLVPLDEEDVARQQEFRDQAIGLTQELSNQPTAVEGMGTFNEQDQMNLLKHVIQYLRFMADGELADAEVILPKISKHGIKAKTMIAEMMRQEEAEPELADIAPQVLKSLMVGLQGEF